MRAIRSWLTGVAAIVGFAALPISVAAQSMAMLGLSGGAALPMGKINDTHSTGFNGMVSIGFGAGEFPLSMRFEGAYTKFNGHTTAGTTVSGIRIMNGSVSAVVSALGGEVVHPYLLAGGGIFNIKSLSTEANSSNNFGLSGGVGIGFDLSGFNTFVEARMHHVFTDKDATRFAPIVFGILF